MRKKSPPSRAEGGTKTRQCRKKGQKGKELHVETGRGIRPPGRQYKKGTDKEGGSPLAKRNTPFCVKKARFPIRSDKRENSGEVESSNLRGELLRIDTSGGRELTMRLRASDPDGACNGRWKSNAARPSEKGPKRRLKERAVLGEERGGISYPRHQRITPLFCQG